MLGNLNLIWKTQSKPGWQGRKGLCETLRCTFWKTQSGFVKKHGLEKAVLCAEQQLGELRGCEIVVALMNTEAMTVEIWKYPRPATSRRLENHRGQKGWDPEPTSTLTNMLKEWRRNMPKTSMTVSGRWEKGGQKLEVSRRQQGIQIISEERGTREAVRGCGRRSTAG